ncbi:hypothetical protein PF005_g22122 [Phytophthora fragariae]|uniref:Uncharacterized protein n=1 Tax=Phytophthora fragariae TaxID=53985 RepID=A0A6A3R915_9STRA|nr:hypothetical protein PF003_g13940 [Phytophthora fragariae]KAE8931027.1 hypothetical protein PF009_g18901 [Phytophthora fragariae]KAE8981207.1 hypothetical protein PF011_g22120 [Phytophthora fragariae]KAE9083985.1 hypothetical protein PF010_g21017 [Phytophthora fragariae]KAE9092521.1 hypothetical protein PF007_g18459 [Phytophthora fragariae]
MADCFLVSPGLLIWPFVCTANFASLMAGKASVKICQLLLVRSTTAATHPPLQTFAAL